MAPAIFRRGLGEDWEFKGPILIWSTAKAIGL